ncbi:hypothetical protein RUMGNA_02754 [Mediterraneibacter gnavus ATCC 29149]|uniref:Uncharacterized protein n=1 Tax=Mediterraneibacter gnavus (strain ATCC 29149 / DSM 114966 / JCM 6515 / VPI C7-9) TaxID=411470 RepID=A7B5B6_MEDG7|nr:hypothetical protein RUMGNA_02754 [Mediterraneibacter gnavus ATCC 29149]
MKLVFILWNCLFELYYNKQEMSRFTLKKMILLHHCI